VLRIGIPVAPRNIFPSNIQGLPTCEVRISEAAITARAARGTKNEATRLFKLAVDGCPKTFIEYQSATAELKALGPLRLPDRLCSYQTDLAELQTFKR
jgi:hypothetical protein